MIEARGPDIVVVDKVKKETIIIDVTELKMFRNQHC